MSWNWRCILRLRDLVSRFLISDVNNGWTTSFWFDNWNPLGPLVKVFGRDGTRRLRIHLNASVADACNEHAWGMQIQTSCCICSTQPETRDHLMLSCPYTEVLWSESRRRFRDTVPVFTNWPDLVLWTSSSSNAAPSNLRMMVVQALFYNIWKQRNNMLHNQALVPPYGNIPGD
ncbi:hypothetical protein DY000_02051790 [Brassica cretica]|uniref:Reverse transcriptase zinc-binding domain-containing protein n=1 Tax=Brassica cretica TaxID=69181 RepID=A0ABQ7AFY9_BRACR|nr:hypothetical protein DY000_02051790 [Brassica cretica]